MAKSMMPEKIKSVRYYKQKMRKRIKYSQNFLRNESLVRKLVENADITPNDIVLEIGAGTGVITQELIKNAKRVIAFELDYNLSKKLSERFQDIKLLELKVEDFLHYKLPNYPYKVFSNIPFNITSAIIKKLTLEDSSPEYAYLIVQHEAVQKFAGKPIDSKNSQIAVILYPWFDFRIVHKFKSSDFVPRPNANVVLIEIKKRQKTLVDADNKQKYEDFITFTFNQFKPNILEGLSMVIKRQEIIKLAQEAGFSPYSRPSELNFRDWGSLYNLFLSTSSKQQKIVKSSFANQLKQQEKIEKIHRTRIDKNWKIYKK